MRVRGWNVYLAPLERTGGKEMIEDWEEHIWRCPVCRTLNPCFLHLKTNCFACDTYVENEDKDFYDVEVEDKNFYV
jgi:hypothetical protein